MVNLYLFITFVKFGLLCFGGGYMTIPLLFDEFVESQKLFNLTEFGNLLAISQLTPGATSMNAATYIGFLKTGLSGAVIATIALALPTFVLANIALFFLQKFKNSGLVQGILRGGQLAALVMLGYAMVLFLGMSVFTEPLPIKQFFQSFQSDVQVISETFSVNWLCLGVFVVSLILFFRTQFSVILVFIICAVIGLFSSVVFASEIDDSPFYPDLCVQGSSGSWINACVCPAGVSGSLCQEEGSVSCDENTPCPDKLYCNNGFCYRPVHYSSVQTNKGVFWISRSIMSHFEAESFCQKTGARLASRSDLGCKERGPGCVDRNLIYPLQNVTEFRGFVWLDSLQNQTQAYYMDLNDGVVYAMDSGNRRYAQALCFKEGN